MFKYSNSTKLCSLLVLYQSALLYSITVQTLSYVHFQYGNLVFYNKLIYIKKLHSYLALFASNSVVIYTHYLFIPLKLCKILGLLYRVFSYPTRTPFSILLKYLLRDPLKYSFSLLLYLKLVVTL